MNVTLVAERYANALFQLALEKNAVEEVYQDSLLITKTCDESKELRLLLKSPIIQSEKKRRIISEIFSKVLNPITLAYLLIMIRKRRESFIPEIARQVVEEYKEYKNILTVHFASPIPPNAENRKMVLELMKNYTKANIDLVEDIDKELIGGFVLSWKDKQYDASISREIEDMHRAMAKVNLYLKGF